MGNHINFKKCALKHNAQVKDVDFMFSCSWACVFHVSQLCFWCPIDDTESASGL